MTTIVILFQILIQFGCKTLDDGGTVGPCVHIYKEAILHVESITNSVTGSLIPAVAISNIFLDSTKTNPQLLTPISTNVIQLDSMLICSPPFSFGTEVHKYSFTVSTRGYFDTTIICNPFYTTNKGGCPSSSDGGLRIRFSMRPM
ncbi:MAG: hypothetical protein NTX44_12535 [Ignavibacteriales bacterium]|nr:hypothetical protein [Ignavibacteriales bacterium]